MPAQKVETKTAGGGGLLQRWFGVGGGSNEVASVSRPTNFRHNQHIGYNPETGFQCSDIPDQWQQIFKKLGIRKKDLSDKDTAKAIFETLSSYAPHEAEEAAAEAPDAPGEAPPAPVPAAAPAVSKSRPPPKESTPDAPIAPEAPAAPEAPIAPDAPEDVPSEAPAAPTKTGAPAKAAAAKAPAPRSFLDDIKRFDRSKLASKDENASHTQMALPDVEVMSQDNKTSMMDRLRKLMEERRGKVADADDDDFN